MKHGWFFDQGAWYLIPFYGLLVGLSLSLLLGGCIRAEQLGAVPAHLACKGKATLVGSGSGFSGLNGSIDCGEGFTLDAGPDITGALPVFTPPAPAR